MKWTGWGCVWSPFSSDLWQYYNGHSRNKDTFLTLDAYVQRELLWFVCVCLSVLSYSGYGTAYIWAIQVASEQQDVEK